MRLTVLGKSPSWQDAGGACSGYLLQDGGISLLIDAGNGVFGKLRRFVDYVEVNAVVLSHMHADHFLDIVPFSYALTYAPRRQELPVDRGPGAPEPVRPRLIAPPGGGAVLRRVVGAWGDEDLVEKAFALEEYAADSVLEVGPLEISFRPVPHFVETYAIAVRSSRGGGRLAFGADSRPGPELVDFAHRADVLLVEATLPRPEGPGVQGHMAPAEAGALAREAQVGRVVLTHISDELDLEDARLRAAEAFGGTVEVAAEGAIYDI